jgi:hypothetical protein
MTARAAVAVVFSTLLLPSDAAVGKFETTGEGRCPQSFGATGAQNVLTFSTDPGLDYATFCYRHPETDACRSVISAISTEAGPYVQLPWLKLEGNVNAWPGDKYAGKTGKNKYMWKMKDDGNFKKVAVPNTEFDDCPEADNTEGTCVGTDKVFTLTATSSRSTPWMFIAFAVESGGDANAVSARAVEINDATDCSQSSPTCCKVLVVIEGARSHASAAAPYAAWRL